MFFMVLDLRLTKVGTQRSPFFCTHTSRMHKNTMPGDSHPSPQAPYTLSVHKQQKTFDNIDGNVLATCDNNGDNIARLPIAVNQDLKTDYELTGKPTNPDDDTAYPTAPKRIYNIAGQKVDNTRAGQVYIIGGKKAVAK